MQDHKRAIIMGTKSFGKGSVQTIQELQNGSAVKITTARYFTPNGRSIQAKGIVPDIELKTLRLPASDDKQRKSYSENDLSGHLSNPDDDKKTDAAKNKPVTDKVKSLSETDFQLYEALNLLKGMNILSQMGQN
jgi:carboxyl-terminal processing protease